jgi:hypothetical protein
VCNQLAWAETETAIRYMEKKDIKKWGFGIQIEEEYGAEEPPCRRRAQWKRS